MAIVTRDAHGTFTKKRREGDGPPLDRKSAYHMAVVNGGKTWSKRFKTRQEAVDEERRMLNAQDDGAELGMDRITLETFIDEMYLPHEKLRVATDDFDENTLEEYEGQIDTHIRKTNIGGMKLRDIKGPTLKAFYLERKQTRGWVGVKSMQNLHGLMSTILALAVEEGYLVRNPAAGKNVRPGKRKEEEKIREAEAFEPEEMKKLFAVSDEDRLAAAWRVKAVGGLRRGEVLGIEWPDVNFKTNEIKLERTFKTTQKTRRHVIGPIKTARRRTVSFDDRTMDMLREHKKKQAAERLLAGELWSNSLDRNPVFTDELGEHIKPQTFSRRFKRLLAKADVRDGHVHELRHTAVTHAARNKMDVAAAAKRFGHSVAVMHNIYTHVTRDAEVEAAEIAASLGA